MPQINDFTTHRIYITPTIKKIHMKVLLTSSIKRRLNGYGEFPSCSCNMAIYLYVLVIIPSPLSLFDARFGPSDIDRER
jgi:hypothetical protein